MTRDTGSAGNLERIREQEEAGLLYHLTELCFMESKTLIQLRLGIRNVHTVFTALPEDSRSQSLPSSSPCPSSLGRESCKQLCKKTKTILCSAQADTLYRRGNYNTILDPLKSTKDGSSS